MKEPFIWYDDQTGVDPGWVLRHSTSEEIGQVHLDEPLDDETEAGALAEAASMLGVYPEAIQVASV